nr:hypothetical protein [Tanacetum cinerariifolium]
MVPFTAAKSDSSRSSLSGYYDQPNYMSHTKSSRAKVRSLNYPGGRRRSKYSNVQQNAKQPEAVGEPKKASYGGTQVSREVSPSSIQEVVSCAFSFRGGNFHPFTCPISVLDDGIYMDDSPSPMKHMQKTRKGKGVCFRILHISFSYLALSK